MHDAWRARGARGRRRRALSCTRNFVADTPARSTRSAETEPYSIARLPSAARRPSSGSPRSSSAPRTMSPEAPEKQSKYTTQSSGHVLEIRACLLSCTCCSTARLPRSRDRSRRCPSARQPRSAGASARMSSSLGSGSPDGWLWNSTIAAAPAAAASRNTSRGWTMLASSVPTVTHGRPHHAMLRVEQHDAELLDRPVAVLRQQQLRHRPRARDLHPLATGPRQRPPSQLDGRQHLRRPRRADSRHAASARRAGRAPGRRCRRLVPAPRSPGRARSPRPAVPEHDRDQLVVAQRRRAEPLQLLARPIVRRNALHRTPSSTDCLPPGRRMRAARTTRRAERRSPSVTESIGECAGDFTANRCGRLQELRGRSAARALERSQSRADRLRRRQLAS